jgi:D-glycero-alpha-D-manno-heptose-7-phosphate kinase
MLQSIIQKNIICRTPFRISFFGGGTDLPSWFEKYKGQVISTSIDKYCYVLIRNLPPINNFKYRLRYFKNELTKSISQIKHPSIKAVLSKYHISNDSLELLYSADLPARSGLGSSSAFTVSLINTISNYHNKNLSKKEIAFKAIEIEQKILRENVGSQDQIACSVGGFNVINFRADKIFLRKIKINKTKLDYLKLNLSIFFIGYPRNANEIEKEKIKTLKKKINYYENLYQISNEALKVLELKNNVNFVNDFSFLLNETWKIKKKLSSSVSNERINDIYEFALKNGANAGKILGAGGGGFMLFFSKNIEEKVRLIKSFKKLTNVNFNFEDTGTKIIYKKYENK